MRNTTKIFFFLCFFILVMSFITRTADAQGAPPASRIFIFCRLGLISACVPAATPTPTPRPTAVPTATPIPTAVPTATPTPTPTPIPRFTISGNVFTDSNINTLKDGAETNLAQTPGITTSGGTVVANANGSFIISNVTAGIVTISYTTLPAGYFMTSPKNGPQPSFQVTVGAACNVSSAPGALCTAGNITNLNFGIINSRPWWQITCADVKEDGINDLLPAGAVALASNASCSTTPGLAFTGGTDPNFGQGQVSSTGQIAGGAAYPEVSSVSTPLSTSYTSLMTKAQNANLPVTDLSTLCSLTNCTLPSTLSHGVYRASGNVTLNAFTFPANQNYVLLINGNLTLQGNMSIPIGSTVLFSASGNIIVAPTVGSAVNSTNSNLDGWYVAGQSFTVNSQGNCNDLRLNVAGSVVVDATGGGGAFQNNRDLCANNATNPTASFIQRLDMVLNAPQFIEQQTTVSQEVSP